MDINNTTKQDIKILSINTLDERINVKNQICLLNNQDYTNEIKIKELENLGIKDSKKINLIFMRENGLYLGTDITRIPFKIIHNELGIKKCRFYDLRGYQNIK